MLYYLSCVTEKSKVNDLLTRSVVKGTEIFRCRFLEGENGLVFVVLISQFYNYCDQVGGCSINIFRERASNIDDLIIMHKMYL